MRRYAATALRILALTLILETAAMATITTRPRLYFDAAGLDRLRALAKEQQPGVYGFAPAAGWHKVLARARRLAAAPTYRYSVQIPAANNEHAGWKWSYSLSATPPPPHDESPHYPPWTAMFQEREDSITTRLKHFALAYAITGEDGFFQKGKEIALALAQWPTWTDTSYSKGSLSACLDTGHATQTVALFYDWCYDRLTAAERQTIREALVNRGILPIRAQLAKLDPYHNFWAVVNTGLGLAALALSGEDPAAEGWVAESIVNTVKQFDRQGPDGGSLEGPMYGTYAADMLAALIVGLDSSQTAHELRRHPFLANLPRFVINGTSPQLKGQPTFGDGGWGAAYPQTMAMLAVAGDEAARYYLWSTGHLSDVETIDRFLFCGPLLQAPALPEPPAWRGSAAFVGIGYGFLRGRTDEEPFLAFKAGPPTENVGHNHFDHNSFQITALGNVVAADPGYRSYFNPPLRRYTSGSLGHNTVVLDLDDAYLQRQEVAVVGHDQVRLNSGKITGLFSGGGLSFLIGEAGETYNNAETKVLERFTREVVYLPPNAYAVVDDLVATQPRTFSWLVHGTPGARADWSAGHGVLHQAGALLHAYVQAAGGVTWRGGVYPGAESAGPYLAATTPRAASARLLAALVPRGNPELIMNGGFEAGLTGWQKRDSDGQGPNHTASAESPRSGQQCGRIAGAGYLYSNRFTLPPGTRYTASLWYRTTGAQKGASVAVYYWNAEGVAFRNRTVGDLKSEGAWREVTVTDTVPNGCATICLAFNYFDAGAGEVDDVTVTVDRSLPATAPPTFEALGPDGLRVTVDEWRHVVARGSAGPVASDGELAVVSYDPAGQPVRALLQQGTKLALDGRPLLTLREPATVALERVAGRWQATVQRDLTPGAPPVDAAAVGLVVAE